MMSKTGSPVSSEKLKSSHPIVFFIFYVPFGIFSGYLTVTLAFLFTRSGISVPQFAALAGVNLLPQMFKFLWAPLVDTTLTVKKWYLLSTLATAATIFATGIVPINTSNLALFSVMIVISSFARSFISAAIGGLAAGTPINLKGRVGGYCQAGNLGGGAIGGGAGLWLAQHSTHLWVPGALLALVCVVCCLGLLFVREPVLTMRTKGVSKTINNVIKDVWQTLRTNRGLLALVLNLVPLGTGAAGFLFASIAKEWKSGADTVALVTGLLGGLSLIIGCLIGGWICDRVDRQKAFVFFSLLQGVSCVGMAFCPHVTLMYIIWTLAYAFVNGFVNAAYSAVLFEAGKDGAAASKVELYASASYLPLYFMFWVSGLAYAKWNAFGMLNMEAVMAIIAAALYFTIKALLKRRNLPHEDVNATFIQA